MTEPIIDSEIEGEANRQVELLRRGTTQLVSEAELKDRIIRSLITKRPLRVKLGVDPTAHELHLGFTLPLSKLRLFQDLGHKAVLIIGDATAMVGDPTGRNKTRPQLTQQMVDDFANSYLDQASKIIDMETTEVRKNSEWLHSMSFSDTIRLAAQSTVAQMLVRDDFSKRHTDGTPIYLHEFIYPLMQGRDSVIVEADVELGGQDQLFNLMVGRDLQGQADQSAQICMMGPLLVGLDGTRKMSKSYGNTIGITDDPIDMFGKVMSLPDDLMADWFELTTSLPMDEISTLLSSGAHPRELKETLARNIVTRFHDEAAADAGSAHFKRVFSDKQTPDEMPDIEIGPEELTDGTIWIVRLIVLAGFAASNGEARRFVKQGGVKLNDTAITSDADQLKPEDGWVLKVGKRRFGRIRLV